MTEQEKQTKLDEARVLLSIYEGRFHAQNNVMAAVMLAGKFMGELHEK